MVETIRWNVGILRSVLLEGCGTVLTELALQKYSTKGVLEIIVLKVLEISQ